MTSYSDIDFRAVAAQVIPEHSEDETATRVEDRRHALTELLVDATELHRIRPPEPLVDGVLDRDSLAWLQGKPGHAKSFVALDLSCHVATGRAWRGRAVTQGRVLYIVAEGASGMKQRLHAWEIGNKTRIPPGVVTFLPVAVQFLDSLDVAALKELVKDRDPSLIVVDTQARVTVGGEENSSKDMGKFVDAADQLRRVSNATILIVHHEARAGENLRGSTAMEGAATTIMRAHKDGRLVTVTNPKQKDGPEFERIAGTLIDAGSSVYYSHDIVGVMQVETETENRILATLWEHFGSTGASTSRLQKVSGIPESSLHRGLKSLTYKGLIRNEGTKHRTCWVPCDQDQRVVGT